MTGNAINKVCFNCDITYLSKQNFNFNAQRHIRALGDFLFVFAMYDILGCLMKTHKDIHNTLYNYITHIAVNLALPLPLTVVEPLITTHIKIFELYIESCINTLESYMQHIIHYKNGTFINE